MADIFISYSSKDREKAEQLTELLASAGLSVWIDKSGIDVATSWSKEIVDAIDECKALVLLLSSSSVDSINVAKELSLAAERGKKILPLDLEPVALPNELAYHLAGIQRTSMTNIDSIIRALGKIGLEATQAPTLKLVKETDLRKSLMILPFEDMSPTGDNGWFADGLASELISALSHVKALRVADPQATKDFKRYQGTLPKYAQEMSIRYFVQGDVRKFGDNIKITSRLLDVETGDFLWQDSMKGTMDDIFDIQEKVAEKVVEGLKVHLASDEKKKLSTRGTENVEAYELRMQAHSYFTANTKQGFLLAIRLSEEAITLDPHYVIAYTMLANACMALYRTYTRDDELLTRAERAIGQALRLKPENAGAYSMMGQLHLYRGNAEEAVRVAKRAIEIDPMNAFAVFNLGFICDGLSRYQEAANAYEAAQKLVPEDLSAHYNLTLSYHSLGDIENQKQAAERALTVYQKYVRLHPDDQTKWTNYSVLLLYAGREEESKREIESLLLLPGVDALTCYNCAYSYLLMQDHPRALELLERAVDLGFARYELFRIDPDFEPLRGTEAWERILEKVEANATRKTVTNG